MTNNNKDVDFINNFINYGRFPIYKYSTLKKIIDNDIWIVEKMPMYVDGLVTWTHFKIQLKPSWRTEPYRTDIDIRITLLEGKAWTLVEYKGKNGGDILEAGDIVIIPNGASYQILNQSKTEPCVYTMDANTLLEIE